MKSSELRELTDAEIQQKIEEAHQELFNLRFQLAMGRLKNYKRIMQVRRDIARLKTEQRRRQLAAAAKRAQEA